MSVALPAELRTATRVLDAEGLQRTVRRLAHEVAERHPGLDGVVLAGIEHGGTPLARLVAGALGALHGAEVPVLALDVTAYRDDRPRPATPPDDAVSGPRALLAGAVVVLVDDVVHTGRTLRAALDLVSARERPAAVEPLVLVDRGHRELPLRATYVGRNLPVASGEWVKVLLDGVPAELAGAWLVRR